MSSSITKPARLTLLGVSASQPTRSVAWLCEWKGIPYEYVQSHPLMDKPESDFKDRFLGNTVPALIDSKNNLEIFEMNAIMVYICREFGLDDVLPRNPAEEAKVHQWLNWHHSNTRMFTIYLFAPLMRPDLGIKIERSSRTNKMLENICGVMEKQLSLTPFLVGNAPTIADLCCYEEVGQCVHLDLYDFSPFPKMQSWMQRMEEIEGYDKVHTRVLKAVKLAIDKVKAEHSKKKLASL